MREFIKIYYHYQPFFKRRSRPPCAIFSGPGAVPRASIESSWLSPRSKKSQHDQLAEGLPTGRFPFRSHRCLTVLFHRSMFRFGQV